jgi:transposase-like protein
MPVYGPQFKEQIVKKMMPPHNQSVAQISRDTGVAVPTLYSWKKLFRNQGFVVPAKSSRPDDWDSKAKLAAIIQTAAMNEAQRSEYCRQHGLYPEQLDAWKAAFESLEPDSEPASKADLAQQRKKLRHLEKEILRKDKALAEAAALLVLSKKPRPSGAQKKKTDSSGDETDGHRIDHRGSSLSCPSN